MKKHKPCCLFSEMRKFFIFSAVLALTITPFHISAQQAVTEDKKIEVQQNEPKKSGDPLSGSLYTYEEPAVENVSYTWLFVKTMVVLVLFGTGVFFAVRFLAKKGAFPTVGRNVISTLSVLPVGSNRQIQVVECGSRLLVVGITDAQITLLREITDKDEIDRMKLQASRSLAAQADTSAKYFVDHFEGFVRSVGTVIGTAIEKGKKGSPNSISIQEFEAAPVTEEIIHSEKKDKDTKKDRYTFFDEEKIDYLQRQKSRLKYMNRFENE